MVGEKGGFYSFVPDMKAVSKTMGKTGPDSRILEEIAAIIMAGFGLLLLLALVSYDPSDLGFYNPDQETTVNFIGPVGAYLAGALIFVFGFASYLFPLVMVVGCIFIWLQPEIHYWWRLLWFTLLLLAGSTLLQIAQPVFSLLPPAPGINWVGGYLGHALADNLLAPNIGTVGAIIVTAIICLSSVVLLFDIRPIEFSVACYAKIQEWREVRLQRRLEEADEDERLVLQKQILDEKIEKEQKKLRRQMESIQPKEAKTVLPPPKVIDTNIPATPPAPGPEPKRREKPVSAAVEEPAAPGARPARAAKPKEGEDLHEPASVPGPAAPPEHYRLPPLDLLAAKEHDNNSGAHEDELRANSELIVETLKTFQIDVEPGDITRGATITRYEVRPASGVRVERIANLSKNLARALKAERINVLAPIPGKDTVGIEVANSRKVKVVLRELFESDSWKHSKARLPLALGKDVYGGTLVADLAEMPHLLIGGTTGSGKSVCINCILLSMVQRFRPDELRLILVDPKVVELQVYNDLPHLVVPVVTSPKKVLVALRWVINEMEKRYRTLARAGVRNISAFNSRTVDKKSKSAGSASGGGELPLGSEAGEEEMPEKLPYIVVIVDELADLMQTVSADVETAIVRLSAKARAAGIHLILATQTPRANVITGLIKTNVPCRVAFQVPQSLDSRVILDENGAENLVGKGDMLYLPPGSSKLIRAQGAFVSDDEVSSVVQYIADQSKSAYEPEIHEKLSKSTSEDGQDDEVSEEEEELVEKCIEIIRQEEKVSTSLLQRRLRIGYNTAARMMDVLEARGVVGPADGAKAREILTDLNNAEENGGEPEEEGEPDDTKDR
jgi:S-DNA-T family DNA segregation ATPase FtsK/SpoIIIE